MTRLTTGTIAKKIARSVVVYVTKTVGSAVSGIIIINLAKNPDETLHIGDR